MTKNNLTPKKAASRNACRFLLPIFLLVFIISLFTGNALAAWDGEGFISNDESAGAVTGNFSLPTASVNDVVGYRFSVYSMYTDSKDVEHVEKAGNSIDIHFKPVPFYGFEEYYHASGVAKKDHVQYYREYMKSEKKTVKIDRFTDKHAVEHGLYYYTGTSDAVSGSFQGTLPADPTQMYTWFSGTAGDANAFAIATLCGAQGSEIFDKTSYYVIAEPIFMITMKEGGVADHYALTMPELAIFQSMHCRGWNETDVESGSTLRDILHYTSARYGRYLYALGSYPLLGTSPVTGAHLKNDDGGIPSVLLPDNDGYCNTAYNVLKYQIGMGIYTKIPAENQYTVKYDGNGATGGSTPDSIHYYGVPQELNPNGYVCDGKSFGGGWTQNADGSGTFYEDMQEVVNLVSPPKKIITIYPRWIPDFFDFSFDT